jgi:hypothetical protein
MHLHKSLDELPCILAPDLVDRMTIVASRRIQSSRRRIPSLDRGISFAAGAALYLFLR